MRIADLSRYGFPLKLIELWQGCGFEYLLPLQVEAVKNYGLLDGKNLLIGAPTSAGKTRCGELAAIKAVSSGRKGLILVPLKAMAAELYSEYAPLYLKAGLKMIAVTADFPESRRRFLEGDYDLAVAVYEMVNALTAVNLSVFDSIGAVVLDEMQLISMADKGVAYELVLSKIRRSFPSIQMVGLIGGLDDCQLFSDWLGWPLLKSTNRPVELHKGVLCNGRFHYRRHNDCREGIEYFVGESGRAGGGTFETLVESLASKPLKDEQAMVFLPTREASVMVARLLADKLSFKPASACLAELADYPDSIQTENLRYCLERGIAFHNADLARTTRRLLEDRFREGEIRVIVSTTTLALGVNFPSRNVFIDTHRCYGSAGGSNMRPILMYDYNQIAGRAGRLGQGDDFGRAILIAENDFQRDVLWETYIYGSARPEIEPFDSERLGGLFLRWFACGLARDEKDCRELCRLILRDHCRPIGLADREHVIEMLLKAGFIENRGCAVGVTAFGRAAAAGNLNLVTAVMIRDALQKHRLGDRVLSWIYYLLETPDGDKLLMGNRRGRLGPPEIQVILSELLDLYREETPLGPLADLATVSSRKTGCNRWQSFVALAAIVGSLPAIEIERPGNIGWGRIRRAGCDLANLLECVLAIGNDGWLDSRQQERIGRFQEMFRLGVPEICLPLARIGGGVERDHLLRLTKAGLITGDDILAAGLDIVSSIIPPRFAVSLFESCRKAAAEREANQNRLAEPFAGESSRKMNFSAVRRGNLYEVTFDSGKVMLQPRLFAYLQKLINSENPDGWLDKSSLDTGLNQVKYMYRLKKVLAAVPSVAIESDRAGRYRIVSRLEEPKPVSI